jgi:hypothetical protein
MEWPNKRTTGTAIQIWKRAAEACLRDISENRIELAPEVGSFIWSLDNCLNFRQEYREMVEEFITIMASASHEQALDMAQAGLDALHDLLLFRIDEYTIVPAKDAFVLAASFKKLETQHLKGKKEVNDRTKLGLTSPSNLQDTLYGLDACAQIDTWHRYGVLETSAAVLAKASFGE